MKISLQPPPANHPAAFARIVAEDGQEIVITVDTDFPGFAKVFGWSPSLVAGGSPCRHPGTDGTIDCPDCHVPASRFISSAGFFLRSSIGSSTNDPGYFPNSQLTRVK